MRQQPFELQLRELCESVLTRLTLPDVKSTNSAVCGFVLSISDGDRPARVRHWHATSIAPALTSFWRDILSLGQGLNMGRLLVRLDYFHQSQVLKVDLGDPCVVRFEEARRSNIIALDSAGHCLFLMDELQARNVAKRASDGRWALNCAEFRALAQQRFGETRVNAIWPQGYSLEHLWAFDSLASYADAGGVWPVHDRLSTPSLQCLTHFVEFSAERLFRHVEAHDPDVLLDRPDTTKGLPLALLALEKSLSNVDSPDVQHALRHGVGRICYGLLRYVQLPNGTEVAFVLDESGHVNAATSANTLRALLACRSFAPPKLFIHCVKKLALGLRSLYYPSDRRFVHRLSFPQLSLIQVHTDSRSDQDIVLAFKALEQSGVFPGYADILEDFEERIHCPEASVSDRVRPAVDVLRQHCWPGQAMYYPKPAEVTGSCYLPDGSMVFDPEVLAINLMEVMNGLPCAS